MRLLCFAAPVVLGGLVLACGQEEEPALEIDPVTECRTAKCRADAGPKEDAGNAPRPEPDGGGTRNASPEAGPNDTNDCQTAFDLGEMAGEPKPATEPPVSMSAQGHCSKWLKLRVNETKNGYIALSIKATLISPASKKFDLYAYVDPDKDEIECTTPLASSATTLSSVDEVDLTWGDSWSNSDSRTVTLEVRSADGSCDPSASWSLLVRSATW